MCKSLGGLLYYFLPGWPDLQKFKDTKKILEQTKFLSRILPVYSWIT